MGFAAGQINVYGYGGNSPTNHTDPTGKFIWLVPLAGAAIGGGIYLVGAAFTGHCVSAGGLLGAVLSGAIGRGPAGTGGAASPWAVGALLSGLEARRAPFYSR